MANCTFLGIERGIGSVVGRIIIAGEKDRVRESVGTGHGRQNPLIRRFGTGSRRPAKLLGRCMLMQSNGKVGLIVEADEPALFFSSPEAAELYMEATDVENGVYKAAYDSEGNPYTISAVDELVVIRPAVGQPSEANNLRLLLLRFLSAVNVPVSPDENLSDLVAKSARFVDA